MQNFIDFMVEISEEAHRVIRVERGMAALDQYAPGWIDKINLMNLDMADCTSCVIGQTFGIDAKVQAAMSDFSAFSYGGELFRYALRDLNVISADAARYMEHAVGARNHGFDTENRSFTQSDWVETYDELRNTWVRLILARRGVTV